MKYIKPFVHFSLLIICLAFNSCKTTRDDSNNPNPRPSLEPGFGKSKERPIGTPFDWLKGITLIGRPGTDYECQNEAGLERQFGNGGNVMLCLNFYNSTNQPINIRLPPGLLFISKSKDVQSGILVSSVTIEVPAGERYVALLFLYCINIDRSGSTPGDEFEEQPIVSQHPGMVELYQLLAGKKVNIEDYPRRLQDPNVQKAGEVIGTVIHDIAAGKPIREEYRRQIEAFPNR